MRVPPPDSFALDREELIEDVRQRLARRYPEWADRGPDPTDTAWLLLEQSAWLVEHLSKRLDRYPMALLQQLLHLQGARLSPARPALGMALLQPSTEGPLTQPEDRPGVYRIFTTPTEERESIEFVPIEPSVPLRQATVDSLAEWRQGELYKVGGSRGKSGLAAQQGWREAPARSRLFEREFVEYRLVTPTPDQLKEQLEKAIAVLKETRNIGWLALSVTTASKSEVVLRARVDLVAAFSASAPVGFTTGDDLVGQWGAVEGSHWRPGVQLADHPLIPPDLRGSRPLPGAHEGAVLFSGLPADVALSELLVGDAAPMAESAVEGIWRTLVHIDTALARLRPAIRRGLRSADDDDEPAWVAAALTADTWQRVLAKGDSFAHITLANRSALGLRVVLVHEGQEATFVPAAFGLEDGPGGPAVGTELTVREAWSLALPSAEANAAGPGLDRVQALDIELGSGHTGALVVLAGWPRAVMVNGALVANAPAVRDGRSLRIQRAVPESMTARHRDLVTHGVVEELCQQPIPAGVRRILRGLPLARMTPQLGAPIRDFEGVSVDASAGELSVNAPDERGRLRDLPIGSGVSLDWYRRTDGALGEVEAGAMAFVEHPARARPALLAVHNPLGTYYGAPRETPEQARQRLFGPGQETPVLAADWERLVRLELGARGAGWLIRCWNYPARSLVSHHFWPLEDGDAEEGTRRLRVRLASAGPEVLLFAVGTREGVISDRDLNWARHLINGLVQRLRPRLPAIRSAITTRLWGLTLDSAEAPSVVLPSHDATALPGTLRDARGRTGRTPPHGQLLNACVIEHQEPR